MLPDINGKEVCHRVRGDNTLEDVRILCISGMIEEDKIQELKLSGADRQDVRSARYGTGRRHPGMTARRGTGASGRQPVPPRALVQGSAPELHEDQRRGGVALPRTQSACC
jgi:hypothetical protein